MIRVSKACEFHVFDLELYKLKMTGASFVQLAYISHLFRMWKRLLETVEKGGKVLGLLQQTQNES